MNDLRSPPGFGVQQFIAALELVVAEGRWPEQEVSLNKAAMNRRTPKGSMPLWFI